MTYSVLFYGTLIIPLFRECQSRFWQIDVGHTR